jgi:hypothetical protein
VKSRELQGLFAQCWQEQLFPALLQLPVSQKEMQGFLQTLLQQSVLHQCAGQIVVQTAQCILAKPVSAWGGWLQLDGMFERLQMQLGFQWQKNGAAALAHWQPLVMEFYGQQVAPITIRQLTRGFTGEIPLADMLQCAVLPDLLAAFQLRLHENLAITRPQQWLHWSQLETRIEQGVATLLQDTAFRQWFCYEGELLILQMTSQWQQLLPEPSRVALTEPVVQALFAVAETYGSKLLTAMDLAQLAETQLLAMDSARLEQVVRGFASQYLVHIENRGWLGAVFALPGMLLYLL